ncbi:MAG: flagellar basal body rod protein FlgB, partial [Acetobacteraceae bacterium]
LDLAERRLAWADRRETVLAQNVANADTPGWHSRDVAPFSAALGTASADLARTDPAHLAGTVDPDLLAGNPKPAGRESDGNAVSLDQELTKVADTQTTQSLVTAIYKSYLGMFRTALGQPGG